MNGEKPLCIRFDKANGFIKVCDGTRHLFGPEKYDSIYNKIRYLISQKSSITYVISHNYTQVKVDSYGPLLLEKTLILYDVTILIKSVFIKDHNRYNYNIFLKKCLHK